MKITNLKIVLLTTTLFLLACSKESDTDPENGDNPSSSDQNYTYHETMDGKVEWKDASKNTYFSGNKDPFRTMTSDNYIKISQTSGKGNGKLNNYCLGTFGSQLNCFSSGFETEFKYVSGELNNYGVSLIGKKWGGSSKSGYTYQMVDEYRFSLYLDGKFEINYYPSAGYNDNKTSIASILPEESNINVKPKASNILLIQSSKSGIQVIMNKKLIYTIQNPTVESGMIAIFQSQPSKTDCSENPLEMYIKILNVQSNEKNEDNPMNKQ